MRLSAYGFNYVFLLMNRIKLIRNQMLNTSDYKLISVASSKLNDKIKIVSINSPKNLNSLTDELALELVRVFEYLNGDHSTKIIILTGSGKAFIAGADIRNLETRTYQNALKSNQVLHKLQEIYYSTRKPIIAAINGVCFGGGLEMALSCDILIASDKAQLGLPEIKLGLFPGLGGTQKLTKVFGYNKACEYILTGKNIPLDEAFRLGLVNSIVKHEELIPKAEEIANQIAQHSLVTLIAAKQAIQFSQESNLRQGLWFEKAVFDSVFSFEDSKIGTRAFLSKTKPDFKDN